MNAWVVLVVVLGLTGTLAGALFVRHLERSEVEDELQDRAGLAASRLEAEMQRYVDVVSSVSAGFSVQSEFDVADFSAATAPMLQAQLRGASGVTFVVPATGKGEVAEVQRAWRARGDGTLTLTAAGDGEHFFIVAARTLDAYRVPIGADISARPEAVSALRESRRFGRATLSDPFVLLMDEGWPTADQQQSIMIAAPVDDPDRGVLRGWVVATLRTGTLLERTLDASVGREADATLAVQNRDGRTAAVAVRDGGATSTVVPDARVPMQIAGRPWTLTLRATTSAARADSQQGAFSTGTAVTGVLVTLLLAGIAHLLLSSRRRALRDARSKAGMLEAVLDSMSDGVGVIDENGAVLVANVAAGELFDERVIGAEAATWWRGYEWLRMDGETPIAFAELPLMRALRGEEVERVELLMRRPGAARPIPLSVAARALDPRAGKRGAVAVFQDITERVEAETDLRIAEERFRFAFDHAGDGMVVLDLSEERRGRFLQVNDAMCRMVGYSREQLLQRTFNDITHPEDRALEREQRDTVGRLPASDTGVTRPSSFEKRYVRADGRTIWVKIDMTVLRGPDGSERYSVAQIEDVTQSRAEKKRLEEMALNDPLTGLGNRVLLMDRLAQAVARTARNRRLVGVVFCDLDAFKPVNDTYGHAAGDEVLRRVADRIRAVVRPADTVARLGGDEFVVLCEDLDDPAQADDIARRIRDVLREPISVGDGAQVRIGCSTGLVTAAGPGVDPEGLLHHADQAMYTNKRGARA